MTNEMLLNVKLANAIRILSVEMVSKANSGHPGMPLGASDIVTVLFKKFLKFSPKNPNWINRDRFILSAGHASAMLYSLLYLTGYEDCTLDELNKFRQLHSKTAGHPEYGFLKGIETTTGPLGQGIANAVGMAIAERKLNYEFENLINYKTYCLCGDGCLMEGIALESLQIAGHLGLSNFVLIYDKNNITIDGNLSITSSVNYLQMFESFGFDIIECDGHNFEDLENALAKSQNSQKPTVIIATTKIGFGSEKEGTAKVHGSPLSKEEIAKLKEKLDINYNMETIPQEILSSWRKIGNKGNEEFAKWEEKLKSFQKSTSSNKNNLLQQFITNNFVNDIEKSITKAKEKFTKERPTSATRVLSGLVLEELSTLPFVLGGSADLSGSNNTKSAQNRLIQKADFSGNYLAYGVREHAMAGIMNGIALSNFLPFGGTFLVFSDYMRNTIRLSAIMNQKVFYIMTHDSIGLGEDGPTHQPVEHLASLRAIPNIKVFRPCDAIETANCFLTANQFGGTSVFALSRQNLPFVSTEFEKNPVNFGGYIIYKNEKFVEEFVGGVVEGGEQKPSFFVEKMRLECEREDTIKETKLILESERCYFRPVEEQDFANWLKLGHENEHNEWTSQYSTAKNTMEENIKREISRAFDDAKLGFYQFILFEKKTDEFIGLVGYKPYQNNLHYGSNGVDLGWAIMKKFQNKGIATEVAKIVMDFAFKNCNFERLQGTARPENIASNRIFQKIGMNFITTYEEFDNNYQKTMQWNLYRMDRHNTAHATPLNASVSLRQIQNPQDAKASFGDLVDTCGLRGSASNKEVITIIATGSEVSLAIDVAKKCHKAIRVVSMPCLEIFRKQSLEYQKSILGEGKRVFIEAGAVNSFWNMIRENDLHFTVDEFGHSGKAEEVYAYFGLTVENILSKI